MAPRRTDPAYPAGQVANGIFGGFFSSRLTMNIREDKGYTYSPHSGIRHSRAESRVLTSADVATEVTSPALVEVLYELGLVGAAVFVAFFAGLVGACVRAARRARDRIAYLPAAWLAGTVGALAGQGFFGGSALAATFWLVAGFVVACALVAREPV